MVALVPHADLQGRLVLDVSHPKRFRQLLHLRQVNLLLAAVFVVAIEQEEDSVFDWRQLSDKPLALLSRGHGLVVDVRHAALDTVVHEVANTDEVSIRGIGHIANELPEKRLVGLGIADMQIVKWEQLKLLPLGREIETQNLHSSSHPLLRLAALRMCCWLWSIRSGFTPQAARKMSMRSVSFPRWLRFASTLQTHLRQRTPL